MSGVKISDLPAATTPLAGTELVPVVQGGVTSKATVSQVGSFTPAGTGAVTRTVQSKLQETVSVKDFGVVGDGSDETAKLQAAFAVVTTGVRLSLKGLTITVSDAMTVNAKSGFVIDGEGGTIIAQNGMAVTANKGLLYLTDCEKFSVVNITFDGNRANRTPAEVYAHTVTTIKCRKFLFENVYSNNAVCDGFYFGATLNTDTSTYCLNFQLIGCYANNCYRQGASVINAYDFQFIGGAFTNTNGTAPQSGVDVESNAGATIGNTRGAFIGVSFTGNAGYGLLLSNVAGSRTFNVDSCFFAGNASGIGVFTDQTHIRGCFFSSNSTADATLNTVRFAAASTIKSGSIENCTFENNTAPNGTLYVHAVTSGIVVRNNRIINASTVGIDVSGTSIVCMNNVISGCGGIGINHSGVDCIIEGNNVSACVGRGIYSSGARAKIVNNKISDITSVSGAYIQAAGADQLVTGNICSAASAVTDLGIRVDSTALAVYSNTCVNLNSTDPYLFSTSFNDDMAYNNIGGSANDRRRVKMGMAVPSYTTAARPAASAVAAGQCIFNTTTLKPNWSDGSANWYNADGTTA